MYKFYSKPKTNNFAEAFGLELPTISLAELNQQAALMSRVDRKYLLPSGALPQFIAELEANPQQVLRVLSIGGSTRSTYASTYFDTDDLLSYRTAATNNRRKFKVRRRTYVDSDLSFLEVKVPNGRGANEKERLPLLDESEFNTAEEALLAKDARRRLRGSAREYVMNQLGEAGVELVNLRLKEALHTSYERTTLLHQDSGMNAATSRITIDTRVSWQLAQAEQITKTLNDYVVVETKGAMRTSKADHLLWRMGFRPARVSKYATGLALLRWDLRGNRWGKSLRLIEQHAR